MSIPNFEIGDIVEVISPGLGCSRSTDVAKLLGATSHKYGRYIPRDVKVIATIQSVQNSNDNRKYHQALIRDIKTSYEYIIYYEGIKKLEAKNIIRRENYFPM